MLQLDTSCIFQLDIELAVISIAGLSGEATVVIFCFVLRVQPVFYVKNRNFVQFVVFFVRISVRRARLTCLHGQPRKEEQACEKESAGKISRFCVVAAVNEKIETSQVGEGAFGGDFNCVNSLVGVCENSPLRLSHEISNKKCSPRRAHILQQSVLSGNLPTFVKRIGMKVGVQCAA